ncbi:MAG: SDR family oxidoreductase [Deltaproteobacteria bacterium]|nr:SDR family oxidoreductase [Deltaproteobacteria bacterium]MBW2420573.1 SDR family oxidoreductase [Deltaproteobacteria bacterium]
MGRLEGKVAVVTGAARGTGEATARLFVAEGARVVIADVSDEAAEKVASTLGERALALHLDVGSEADWSHAVEETLHHFGGLDILVNNAGLLHMCAIEETTLADYERIVRVNQIGTFLGIRSVVEPMRSGEGGSIVNISSVDGCWAKNGLIAYSASKWAIRGMTRVAAIELGRFGIRVNAVCPEQGSAEMIAPFVPEGIDATLAQSFMHPLLPNQQSRSNDERVGDIAEMIAFLASDAAASCTGADYAVDSGNTAGRQIQGMPGS